MSLGNKSKGGAIKALQNKVEEQYKLMSALEQKIAKLSAELSILRSQVTRTK